MSEPATAPRIRSALFVPANREAWVAAAYRHGADAVVIDLEDATPPGMKAEARQAVLRALPGLRDRMQTVWVRINDLQGSDFSHDLETVCQPGVQAICVPKVMNTASLVELDRAISFWEGRRGLEFGTIGIIPLVETADAILSAREIFRASSRVRYAGGMATSKGDVERSVGFRWTDSFQETYVLRAHALLAARAADIDCPLTGIVTELDLPLVRTFAEQSRELGYAGMYVIHPSHVDVANEVFSPSSAELKWAEDILAAYSAHEQSGAGTFLDSAGRLVDLAHVRTAKRIVADHTQFARSRAGG
jgi:citrate lyase subunit beta / citryl-CoA lyase